MSVSERIRGRLASARGVRMPRRVVPLLVFAVVVVYIMLGAAAFLFLEQSHHENGVRRWYLNLAVHRRQFARSISNRIFNDTRNNLLVIIDREQSDRVQKVIADALSDYERQIDMHWPDKHDWNLLNSLNYALGLLTTVGHGTRIPATIAGQIFAFAYALIGIPFFLGAIALFVYRIILPLFQHSRDSLGRRLLHIQLAALVFVAWLFIVALFLHNFVIENGFWHALFAAGLSMFTVQLSNYSQLSAISMLVLMLATCVALALAVLLVLLAARAHRERERRRTVRIGDSTAAVALAVDAQDGDVPPPHKFNVVIDAAGESKLAG